MGDYLAVVNRDWLTDNHLSFFMRVLQEALEAVDPTQAKATAFIDPLISPYVLSRRWDVATTFLTKLDIFDKQYVFIPLCDGHHWSLTFVYKPGHALQPHPTEPPLIAQLNSMRHHAEYDEEAMTLIDGLFCAYARDLGKSLPTTFARRVADVPQQNNNCDCSLFVMAYIERIIAAPGEAVASIREGKALFTKKFKSTTFRTKFRKMIEQAKDQPHAFAAKVFQSRIAYMC
ncbi:hypothetical protein KEM52_002153 [Ascosphaera acerosa]|nr:hypothetical protein KEM52_002153 [Ascosphaera acerosa]